MTETVTPSNQAEKVLLLLLGEIEKLTKRLDAIDSHLGINSLSDSTELVLSQVSQE